MLCIYRSPICKGLFCLDALEILLHIIKGDFDWLLSSQRCKRKAGSDLTHKGALAITKVTLPINTNLSLNPSMLFEERKLKDM